MIQLYLSLYLLICLIFTGTITMCLSDIGNPKIRKIFFALALSLALIGFLIESQSIWDYGKYSFLFLSSSPLMVHIYTILLSELFKKVYDTYPCTVNRTGELFEGFWTKNIINQTLSNQYFWFYYFLTISSWTFTIGVFLNLTIYRKLNG